MTFLKTTRTAAAAIAIALGAAAVPTAPAFAADAVYTKFFSDVAVSGYDPVAYFTDSKPTKGKKSFQTEWNGATWRFASEANLATFKENPEAYAPQFGGYCAWAVSQGYTASADPKQWTVHNGKLYLNYNAEVQADWEKDKDGFIAKAEVNWPSVLE
ncbi:MAG: YHS domain-containing (seleno)protein [Pseudomonadota bacterium]